MKAGYATDTHTEREKTASKISFESYGYLQIQDPLTDIEKYKTISQTF